ncbi:MAG: glycosyltransferase family 4 protein [bacterium]|nr:glycosyltransferase family 4 protein [bacterium]
MPASHMEKLKICFVVPEYNLETATHFYSIYKMLDLLAQSADIFLIAERGKGDSAGFKKFIQKFHFLPLRWLENLILLAKARMSGCQNFYIHYSFVAAFNASLISGILGGKVFYWNCGLPWLYRKNFLRNQLERLAYRFIDFLVTGTESLKKEYAAHYAIRENKIKVMPNWVDIEKIKNQKSKIKIGEIKQELKIPEDAKVLLFVHRLSQRKGAHYLPEILKALQDENAVLVVIGDGPERESIKSQITNYKLLDKVRFLGWVPNNQLPYYYAAADLFIMPSDEEGFPHVLLESMAAAVPFVASDIGGVREITPEPMHSYLARVGDTGQFADKVKALLYKKPSDLALMKILLLDWVKRYDIRNSAAAFIKIIQTAD